MKPTYIGIGAQKCASTWVHYILQDHPQAFASQPKELNFFSHNYDRGRHWYERHFAAGAGRAAVGEISPSYFYDSAAPLRAQQYNPALKIIAVLRDPVERAYSNHLHEVRVGHYHDSDLSFEAGFANNPMYLEQSCYARHLTRWLQCYPRGQILVLLQEEITTTPVTQARRVYEFLEIAPDHESVHLHQRANESRQLRFASIDTLFKRAGTLARGVGLQGLVAASKNTRVFAAARRANSAELRQIIPPMQAHTRTLLQSQLRGEMQDLAQLLERPSFPWASWNPVAAGIMPRKQLASHE